ncbi:MAG: DUF3027 domain-containing protein [Mycobacterium sp.]|nr:DUF3027 domain-containing protein [Mycobacterium sp.]
MNSPTDTAEPSATVPPSEPSDAVGALLRGAVEQARAAVIEFSGDSVGDYLGVEFEDAAAATHRFLATMAGYQGWQWAVVLAAVPGAERPTVSEVVLIPGPGALLAPQWLPWEERVRPGDLGPGDLLAPLGDDPRLVPGFFATGDPAIDEVAAEVGFGRRRVLSAYGRDEAAQRWHDGDRGPDSPTARATKRMCRDCGFMAPLAGALGVMFGVCCNAMSADGQVVDYTYGCGAHSDTPAPPLIGSPNFEPYDDGLLEVVEVAVPQSSDAPEAAEVSDAAEVPEVPEVPGAPAPDLSAS